MAAVTNPSCQAGVTLGFVALARSVPAGEKNQVFPHISPSPGWVRNKMSRKRAQAAARGEQRAAHERVQGSAAAPAPPQNTPRGRAGGTNPPPELGFKGLLLTQPSCES